MPSDDAAPPSAARLLGLTAEIVAAHVSRNPVAADQLPELIRAVHRALGGLGQNAAPAEPARLEPAVPIRRSVQHDRIICLECGAAMSMLKRHLAVTHHLTPMAYRERWGLGWDYPMTAPDYAEVRAGLAKQMGLGRRSAGRAKAATVVPDAPTAAPAPARGRGRRHARGTGAR